MKVGDKVFYREHEGVIIGKTISLMDNKTKIYFVMLSNGVIVEETDRYLTIVHSHICEECIFYTPVPSSKYHTGRCYGKFKISNLNFRTVYSGDPICKIFKQQ